MHSNYCLLQTLALTSLLLGSAANAVPARDCANSRTQVALNACMNSEFETADRTLNSLYQQLMRKLQPADAKLLKDTQRSWITFKDKHCAFVANPNADGSIYPSILSSCAATVTSTRATQLYNRLNCQEGDMGCGS